MRDDKDGIAYQLLLPDGTVYSHHDTAAEWCVAYVNMVARIKDSDKLKPDAKQAKLDAFKRCNEQVKSGLPMTDKLAISQMIATGDTGAVVHDLQKAV